MGGAAKRNPVDTLVVLGSRSDAEKGNIFLRDFKALGATSRVDILSCHRNIEDFKAFVRSINAKIVVFMGGMEFAAGGILESFLVAMAQLEVIVFVIPLDSAARSACENLPAGTALITSGLNEISVRHSIVNSALAVARLLSVMGNEKIRRGLVKYYKSLAAEKRWEQDIKLTSDGLIPIPEPKK